MQKISILLCWAYHACENSFIKCINFQMQGGWQVVLFKHSGASNNSKAFTPQQRTQKTLTLKRSVSNQYH